jgi:hypothetical protein
LALRQAPAFPSGNRGDIAYVQLEFALPTKIFLIVAMKQHILTA